MASMRSSRRSTAAVAVALLAALSLSLGSAFAAWLHGTVDEINTVKDPKLWELWYIPYCR